MPYVQSASTEWFGGFGPPWTQQITLVGVAPGNAIALFAAWSGGAVPVVSIADGVHTYVDPGDTLIDGATGRSTTRYVINTAGGTITITITWGSNPGFGVLIAHEFSGADTTAPLDQHAIVLDTGGATGTDGIAGSAVTTTTAGQYIFGAAFDEGGGAVLAGGTGYARREIQTGVGASEDIQSQGSAGSTTVTFTETGDDFGTYHVATMTFKAAGGAADTLWAQSVM